MRLMLRSRSLSESFGFLLQPPRPLLPSRHHPLDPVARAAHRRRHSAATAASAVVLAEKVVDVIPTVMFIVPGCGWCCWGPGRIERLPGLGWSRRETAFLVHLIKVAGIHLPADRGLHLDRRHDRSRHLRRSRRSIPNCAPARGAGGAARHRLHRFGTAGAPGQLRPGGNGGRPRWSAAALMGLRPRQQLADHRQPVR